MASLANLRVQITDYGFKRTDKTSEIKRAINDTLKEIAGLFPNRKLQDQKWMPLVTGQEDYGLPDGLLRIAHPVRFIGNPTRNDGAFNYPMIFVTKDEYDALEPNPNASSITRKSRCTHYTIWKRSILVWPLPDASTYRIEMNLGSEITILNAEVDAHPFSDIWDETICAGALSRLYAGLKMYEDADIWNTVYRWGHAGNERGITGGLELMKQIEESQTSAPLIVRPNVL